MYNVTKILFYSYFATTYVMFVLYIMYILELFLENKKVLSTQYLKTVQKAQRSL